MIENLNSNGIRRITPQFIESLCYTSDNPIFRTEEFRLALIDYRRHGLATKNRKDLNIDDEIGFIKTRMGKSLEL